MNWLLLCCMTILFLFVIWGLCAAAAIADHAHLDGMVDDGEDWP